MLQLRMPQISKEGKSISWIGLFYGIAVSLLLPIFPTFIEDIINSESLVGYFYSGMAIAMIIGGLLSPYLFKKFSRTKVLLSTLIFFALLTLSYVFVGSTSELLIIEFLRTFIALLIVMTLSLMVNDYTESKDLGKTEGVYFFVSNLGWLIGVFLGGVVAKYYGVEPIFALSGLMLIFAFIYFSHQQFIEQKPELNAPQKKHIEKHTLKRIKEFFKSGVRARAYFFTLAYLMWPVFKAVAIPLFVKDAGFGSDTTGLIMALAIVPLVLFEMPVGEYADKHGVKKPFILGFLILAVCALGICISPIFILDAALIACAGIGASFIEPLHDTYFFKNIKKEEEDEFYGVFITASPIARFIAPAIISTILIFAPFKAVFLVFGIIFLGAAFVASKMKT